MRAEPRLVRRLALGVVAGLLLAGCGEPTADADRPAYDPTYFDGVRPVLYHWAPGATIRFFADPVGAPANRDLAAALDAAFGAWRDGAYFREFRFALVQRPEDADVIVHFTGSTRVTYADCTYPGTGAGGITFFCPSVEGDRVLVLPLITGGGNVRMDVRIDENRVADDATFRAVVTHEVGHVLGIGAHSPDPTDLMYAQPRVATPSDRDAATLRYVLHQPSALVL